ncbi:MAG: hypothetical protein PVSMB1_17740 [Gemmatimonadaceae bacterium]
MENVEGVLPNGFHDGVLRRLSVDYAQATMCLEVDFWIGTMEDEDREVYRLGRVTISGLEFLAIDSPHATVGPHIGELIVDGGPGQPSTSPVLLPPLGAGSFLYWGVRQ